VEKVTIVVKNGHQKAQKAAPEMVTSRPLRKQCQKWSLVDCSESSTRNGHQLTAQKAAPGMVTSRPLRKQHQK
jgi:hypothetical protein